MTVLMRFNRVHSFFVLEVKQDSACSESACCAEQGEELVEEFF